MTESQPLPAVCIVGSSQVGKHTLVCNIMGNPADKAQGPFVWQIDNKYYTCDVELEVHRLVAEQQTTAHYEAIIAVFDPDNESSFLAVQQWWERNKDADPSIKLAVARTPVSPGTSCLSQAQEWCLDEMLELVILSEQCADVSESLASREGDSGGIERVREALEAHMWPGLQLKRPGRQLLPNGDSSVSTKQRTTEGGEEGQLEDTEQLSAANIESLAMLEASGIQIDELEKIFIEAAGAREKLQSLGDVDRREAAADIVLKLMKALDMDDSDNDSEDDSI